MQKKRNIHLIISLVILLVATVVAYWFSDNDQHEKFDKNIFRVQDYKNINKIILESRNGKVELKFNGTRWLVNDKYDADRNLIDILFATLQQVEPKRPVASSLKDSLSIVMESNGVKVSLLSSDKTEKVFIASGNQQKTQAYFKEANDDTPYIMVIPGYRVYASGILELDESSWRDKRIFNFNWQNFKSLTATIPSKPDQNFKVGYYNQQFTIEGSTSVDTTKMNNYLDVVSLLTADKFISKNNITSYDSLIKTEPALILDVADVADRHYQLSIYPKSKNEENIVGKVDSQIMVFNPQSILPIIKTKEYFTKRP
jgi:hypothetical protein